LALALFFVAAAAHADETAKSAYEEGLRAHKAGDFAGAAAAFARADAIAPNDVALKAALDAAVRADDPVLGGELIDRAQGRSLGSAAQASLAAATAKLAHRSGFLVVDCIGGCTATVDGKDVGLRHPLRTTLGQHVVVAHFPGARDVTVNAAVNADETSSLHFGPPAPPEPPPTAPPPTAPPTAPPPTAPPPTAPPPTAPPPTAPPPLAAPVAPAPAAAEARGLPPFVFFIGLGVTGALGLGAVLSGVTTKGLHDDFVAADCGARANTGCATLSDDGSSAQLRTNVLGAVTGVVGVASLVVGIFFTRWRAAPARIAPGPGAAGVSVVLDF
jgi:hypothetical protein